MRLSRWAIAQLKRGSNISQKSAPILDKYFNDDNIFAKDLLASPYVSPKSTISTSASKVRGLPAIFVNEIFSNGVVQACPVRKESAWLKVLYLPPWHPLAAGRSTRPAVTVGYRSNTAYNGEKIDAKKLKFTFASAVLRGNAKRLYKRLFMDAWNASPEPRDGFYMVIAKRYPLPNELPIVRKQFDAFVARVSAMGPRDFEWVSRPPHTRTVPKKVLRENHLADPEAYSPEAWGWGRLESGRSEGDR